MKTLSADVGTLSYLGDIVLSLQILGENSTYCVSLVPSTQEWFGSSGRGEDYLDEFACQKRWIFTRQIGRLTPRFMHNRSFVGARVEITTQTFFFPRPIWDLLFFLARSLWRSTPHSMEYTTTTVLVVEPSVVS